MPVSSLFDLAKARLIQNIHMLDDIGDLPYAFLAPVLRHIQNPAQLVDLETNCPQICGETTEIWRRFIKRDIPDFEKKPHQPRDPKNWGKVYKKLKKDAEQEEEAQKEALRLQMQALQQDRKGHQTTIVESRAGQVPAARRKAFAFGSGGSSWAKSDAPNKTGKAAFDKLRRGIFDHKQARPKAALMPAHLLAERKSTVIQAPARMVRMQEHDMSQRRMVISKEASASVCERSTAAPSASRPNITSRPAPRPSEPTPEKLQRTRLPAGQTFSAPKLQPQRPAAPGAKRAREEPRLFHQPKRRKM